MERKRTTYFEDGPYSEVNLLVEGRRAEKMDLTRYEGMLSRRINTILFDF